MAAGWPSGDAFSGPDHRRAALADRVTVVTGASRGLGAGMAVHFAAAGIRLGLCAQHRPAGLLDLEHAPGPAAGPRGESPADVVSAAVDVTDHGALERFAAAVVERFGRIDLWVNNAGLLEPIGPLAGAAPTDVARHVEVNVTGALFGAMVFARHVASRPGGGVLVTVSSGAATRAYAGWAAYCASKAAIEMMTESVALEEGGHGLRAFAVAPGVVDTDMQAAIRAAGERRFPETGRFRRIKEEGGFNSPSWVAEKLLELAFGDMAAEGARFRVPPEPRPGQWG